MQYQLRTMIFALAFLVLAACGGGHPSADTTSTTPTTTTPTTSTNPPATITFTSATPQVVGLQGSGQTTTSNLIFTVTDSNGVPVADGVTVDFSINTLNGGEFIGPNDTTPLQAVAQTGGGKGEVSIGLTSGTVAGTIIVHAVVDGTSISSESSKISIGGGVVDTAHFSLSTTKFNLAGMVVDGDTATIQALLGDRFGNYNVLQGTPVKFYAEAGAIDTSNITDKNGATTVTFRTQSPYPYNIPNTDITSAEVSQIQTINTTFGTNIPTDGSVMPRREWVTILATVPGEENFIDNNANGYYDAGDTFNAADTVNTDLSEPYIDANNNGQWDTGEIYIDTVSNGASKGVFNGPNGVWDGPNCPDTPTCQSGKTIWRDITLMFTGNARYCAIAGDASIASKGVGHYQFMVADSQLNPLVGGTKISVSTTSGTLSGDTSYTVADAKPSSGPTIINFALTNTNTSGTPVNAIITVKVTGATVGGYTIQGCPTGLSDSNNSLDVTLN